MPLVKVPSPNKDLRREWIKKAILAGIPASYYPQKMCVKEIFNMHLRLCNKFYHTMFSVLKSFAFNALATLLLGLIVELLKKPNLELALQRSFKIFLSILKELRIAYHYWRMRWEDKMLCCGLYGLCHIYSATISVLIGLILANKKDPVSKLLNFFNLKEIEIMTNAVSTCLFW